MILSQALEGYRVSKLADGFSENTLIGYQTHYNQLIEYLGDIEVDKVTSDQLKNFMVWLRRDYIPRRLNADQSPYHSTTIRNAWCAIRSFYKWAHEELHVERPDLELRRPPVSYPEVTPFTQEEIKALLKACNFTKQVDTVSRQVFRMRRPTAQRDRLLIYLLVDTGMRVSECVNLRVKDVNLENGEVFIRPFNSSRKNKSRTLRIGTAVRRSMWSYLASRTEKFPEDKVFLSKSNQPFTANGVRQVLRQIGQSAGVRNVYPHRFRHTFAIQFLRNGGDVFSLQHYLGHHDWTMTRHYANLAKNDLQGSHRRASPADNWRL